MKKIFLIFILFSIGLFLSSCNEEEISFEAELENSIITVGESTGILVSGNVDVDDIIVVYDEEMVNFDGRVLTGLKEGETNIEISFPNSKLHLNVVLRIKPKEDVNVEINTDKLFKKYFIGESLEIKDVISEADFEKVDCELIYGESKNKLSLESFTLKEAGNYKLVINNGEENLLTYEFKVENFEISKLATKEIDLGDYHLNEEREVSLLKELTKNSVEFTTIFDNKKINIDFFKIIPLISGEISFSIKFENSNVGDISFKLNSVDLSIKDEMPPVIEVSDAYINWGDDFDLLEGVIVTDDVDSNAYKTLKVSGDFDNKNYGTYKVTYTATDKSGNVGTKDRNIVVGWNYKVKFIGHAGSYYGVQNSEQACRVALEDLKYQSLECDLKITKDGVFVIYHDDAFAGKNIGSTTWAELSKLKATSTRTTGYPSEYGEFAKLGKTGKYSDPLFTLEGYLKLCKQYNAEAIIELKGCAGISGTDCSNMPKLMEEIKKCEMLDNVTFLASNYHALIWCRENGYDYIPCQYLVNQADKQEYLDRCIKYGFDLSLNVTYGVNSPDHPEIDIEWIKKFKDAGCKISTWTFTQYCDYKQVQYWLDAGVDYLTCDWQRMDKLNLKPALYTGPDHLVKFVDLDGKIVNQQIIHDGDNAKMPWNVKTSLGYEIIGWDHDLHNITEDLTIKPIVKPINYNIKYEPNLYYTSAGVKYYLTRATFEAPTTNNTYNILDEFMLPIPKSNLEFDGWYLEADCKNKVTNIYKGTTGDKTFYAKWKNVDFVKYESNITYELDGGENNISNKNKYTEGIKTSLYAATKEGFDFIGWSKTKGGETFNEISETTTGDIKLFANYKYHEYKLAYNLNGGSWYDKVELTGTPKGSITTNANSGYWTDYAKNIFLFGPGFEDALFAARVFLNKVSGNVYEIIYIASSGDAKYTGQYDYCIIVGFDHSKYSTANTLFKSMSLGDYVKLEGTPSTGNATASFYPKSALSGSTEKPNVPTSYTIETAKFNLPVAYKDGYTFVGWSQNSDGTSPINEIETTLKKDLNLYAVFIEK